MAGKIASAINRRGWQKNGSSKGPVRSVCATTPRIGPGREVSCITLPGAIFLAIIAILPAFAVRAGIGANFAQFYGGPSLLILVGVVLDTLQQIESYLLMRHYEGMMKSGRVKGRSQFAAA